MNDLRAIVLLLLLVFLVFSLGDCGKQPAEPPDPLAGIVPQAESVPPLSNTPRPPSGNGPPAAGPGVMSPQPSALSVQDASIAELSSPDVCTRVMAHLYEFCEGRYHIGDDSYTKEQAAAKCRASSDQARDCFSQCIERVATKLDCPEMLPCIDDCNSNFVPKVK